MTGRLSTLLLTGARGLANAPQVTGIDAGSQRIFKHANLKEEECLVVTVEFLYLVVSHSGNYHRLANWCTL